MPSPHPVRFPYPVNFPFPVNVQVDKYVINHTGDGQADRQTITEVCTGNIYEFVRSNVMTPGVTEHRI